jgi:hypothetical protein
LFSTLTQNTVNAKLSEISASLADVSLQFNATTQQRIGQKFKFLTTGQVTSIIVSMKKVGTPVGTLTAKIITDSAGLPTGTLVRPP